MVQGILQLLTRHRVDGGEIFQGRDALVGQERALAPILAHAEGGDVAHRDISTERWAFLILPPTCRTLEHPDVAKRPRRRIMALHSLSLSAKE